MEEKLSRPKRQKLEIADSTSSQDQEQGSSSASSSSTSTDQNTEEKSLSTEEEGTEGKPKSDEVKFNVRERSHQNRSYRRTCALDSDDDSEPSSPVPAAEEVPNETETSENQEREVPEEPNNNEEHEIMSGIIEFGDSSSSSTSLFSESSSSISSSHSSPMSEDGAAMFQDEIMGENAGQNGDDGDIFIMSDNSVISESDTDQEAEYEEERQNLKTDTELVNKLIDYPKIDYNWSLKEILSRENGFKSSAPRAYSKIHSSFESRFYSSRVIIEKLRVEKKRLSKHKGCVNCLNFNKKGDMLVSGSDDLRVILWDWPSRKIIHNFKSGHTANIFQTKFVELNNSSASIVSSARDGTVRFSQIPPSGLTEIQPKKVYSHSSAVHKIALNPSTASEIMSAGEDGCVFSCDIRTNDPGKVISVEKANGRKVRLYSISHHPYDPQICIGGTSQFVYVYDKRNYKNALTTMSPNTVTSCDSHKQVTCALYNYKGDEILASYSYDNAYLFDNHGAYESGTFKHSYIGHLNRKTIKGINFFGSNSEYIISGSDCGNVFFWDRKNESIINVFKGDTHIVNCLEPHPTIPVMAVSGLDNNIKIVSPGHKVQPGCSKDKIKDVLMTNIKRKQNVHVNRGAGLIIDIFQEFMRGERFDSSPPNSTDETASVEEFEFRSDDSHDDDDGPSEIRPCVTQ